MTFLRFGDRQKRIESLAEVAVHLAVVHQLERLQNVIGRNVELGQPIIGEVVVGRGGRAPHRFLEADEELLIVLPVAGLLRPQRLEGARRHIGRKVLLLLVRDRQITGDQLRHQADVGQALDVGVAAQRIHAAPAHADVAEHELQHRHGADVLRALGVLGPAERVHRGHRLGRRRGLGDHRRHFEELVLRRAADALDELGRILRDVLPSGDSTRSADCSSVSSAIT